MEIFREDGDNTISFINFFAEVSFPGFRFIFAP